MPRDLFVDTVTHKYAPKRSKWTIAGSILAHTALLCAVLVVPILSALDDYVVYASKLTFTLPQPVMPAASVPPPPKAAAPVPTVNPNAAPPAPPEQPVTGEVTAPASYRPVPAGMPIGTGNSGILGAGPGERGSVLETFRQPEPKKTEPIRPGGAIKTPSRTYYVEPVYPSIARTTGLGGYVILEAILDESGAVKDVKVLKSNPMFDRAALEAVAKWRYTPTQLNGVAVPVVMTVTVTFAIR